MSLTTLATRRAIFEILIAVLLSVKVRHCGHILSIAVRSRRAIGRMPYFRASPGLGGRLAGPATPRANVWPHDHRSRSPRHRHAGPDGRLGAVRRPSRRELG